MDTNVMIEEQQKKYKGRVTTLKYNEDVNKLVDYDKEEKYRDIIPERVCMVFDMDGTLTEPWFGEESPDFYRSEEDAVLRSRIASTYTYVKPLPYVEQFLSECKNSYPSKVDFKCLTRIVNGKEYLDKVSYIKDTFSDFDFEVLGAISEEDKMIYLKKIADGTYDRVYYFDDTIGTLNLVGTLKTETFILCCHSTAMLTRTVPQLHKAWQIEKKLSKKY